MTYFALATLTILGDDFSESIEKVSLELLKNFNDRTEVSKRLDSERNLECDFYIVHVLFPTC